ncbi:MAG: sensor histidine kinase [Oscillatoriales cyanobacterium]|nr:MAG: sensor histidine kinase [Oscillatoriales cyanobacterium]
MAMASIFFSCSLGHGFHALGMLGIDSMLAWQTVVDFLTVIVAVRFLSFYGSFDLLSQISQIVASKDQLESDNQKLADTIDQLKRTQLQLIQSEKMSGLGKMVAGIAHEVNNPVNFIHGNLSFLQQYTRDLLDLLMAHRAVGAGIITDPRLQAIEADLDFLETDLSKILQSIEYGTNRIRDLVMSLRTFSRLDESAVKSVNLHDGIDSALMILHHRFQEQSNRPAIRVVKYYGSLPDVECYPSQLNQVFLNILINAVDALDERGDRLMMGANPPYEIVIHTESIHPPAADTPWVKVSIADTGCGIPESICQRVFDPFFTTKPIGKGTGIGLSVSYQVVTDRHQGTLSCTSQEGQGTELMIQIPVRQSTYG